jgi:hypothetical protein
MGTKLISVVVISALASSFFSLFGVRQYYVNKLQEQKEKIDANMELIKNSNEINQNDKDELQAIYDDFIENYNTTLYKLQKKS